MRSFAQIFARTVRETMSPPPPVVKEDSSCLDAVAKMTHGNTSCVIVQDSSGGLKGILTEVDVARRIAFRIDPDSPVSDVMTSSIVTINPDDMLYRAVGIMRHKHLRHLPVVENSKVVGILRFREALAVASSVVVDRIDDLVYEDTIAGLKRMRSVQVEIAMAMLEDGIGTAGVQGLISHVNRDVHRRIIERIVNDMKQDGMGEPPVEFCAVIMGSGGRNENYLYPDQDNGLILADYEDERHNEIDSYFIELSERMTRVLYEVGFPLCKGFVMATNPIWRKTISQWKQQTSSWTAKRSSAAVRFGDIFFDFVPVWGKKALASQLRKHITELLRNNVSFLSEVVKDQRMFKPAIRTFGRFKTEPGPPRGRVDLKKGGLQMLVNSIRILALQNGVSETSTLARIDGLKAIEKLSINEAEELTVAFTHISTLLLKHQIGCFNRRKYVTNAVVLGTLSRLERQRLKEALHTVVWIQERVAGDLTGDVLSA